MDTAVASGRQGPPASVSPTVGVVLVVRDPGSGFDEVLAGLAAQDHRDLRILVVDSGWEPVADRVVAVLPDARVIAGHHSLTFGAAANLILNEGPHPAGSFHLFLSDDLVLTATAVRRMVEAALEANAGVVGSKVLAGEDPTCLDDICLLYTSPSPRDRG